MEYLKMATGVRKGRFLREQVYKRLKETILDGNLAPNTRLIEEKIASEIGTSRTPVREAIQKLEKEGLIKKLPKGGFAVSKITEADVEDVFGIRSVLEGYAGYLATLRAKEEDIKALEEIVKKEEEYVVLKKYNEIIQLNTEFHDKLYRTARSERLYNIINDLRDYIYRFRRLIFSFEGMAEVSIKDHKDMIELMKAKKASKVESLIRRHIIRGKKLIKRKLKKDPEIYGNN